MTPRTALVTGGAGGIGSAIAGQLASSGLAVAVADLDREAASGVARELGGATGVELDVTSPRSVAAAAAEARAALGGIDVVVNNAGWDELRPFLDTDEDFWDRVIEINFKGCLRVTHAVLPAMVERGFGRVINIASDAARVGSTGEAVYAGAKGGVISFTKTIARELARSGVTANVVSPGPTRTPLLEGMAGEQAGLVDALKRAIPMRRLGEPEDVAAAVAFLASERAAFITGQTLSVSGGLTMA